MLALVIWIIFGVVCAAIASTKGRSVVGWFFIGFFFSIIGLIIILVLSNVKEEESRRLAIEQENRRLREQIHQEQIKSETFRAHTQRRLDLHDRSLGQDTRADDRLLDGTIPLAGLLESGSGGVGTQYSSNAPQAQAASASPGWYYAVDGQTFGPVVGSDMTRMLRVGAIPTTTLVWRQGMPDWLAVTRVPEFNSVVNS